MNQRRRRWRDTAVVSIAVVISALGTPMSGTFPTSIADAAAPPAAVEPALQAILERLGPTEKIRIVVTLRDQVDPRSVGGSDRRQRRRELLAALHGKADSSQAGVRAALRKHPVAEVSAVTSLWIVNAIVLDATSRVVRELADRSDVARISAETTIAAPEPEATPLTAVTEPNINQIGAPAVWALGQQGSGAIVASIDTGVDLSNPDLSAAWRGGTNGWFDPYGQHPTPADSNGHGTQTLGVAVGGTDGGTAIGVAPAARWIAAKIFNDSGVATSTAIHQAFQWVLDPDADPLTDDAPDVVNNSWAIGSPGCDMSFVADIAALVSADIVPVFAAGNFGPGDMTSVSPANEPGAFSVGAVDGSDAIADFSSRGPTSCGGDTPRTFPSVVGPGVDIRTSDRFGLYGNRSGTSYSAPHVSGAIALLRGAVPAATVEQLERALVSSAVELGLPGPDDSFGAGRIDVRAAYDVLVAEPTPTPTPTPTPVPTPTPTPTPTPGPDLDGPIVGVPVIAPTPANGTTDVIVSAVIDDRSTGASDIVAGELWVDDVGPSGSGTAMSGSFGGEAVTTAVGSLSTAVLAGLDEGAHIVSVHGKDVVGNWGPVSVGTLVIDRNGPAVTGGHGSPDPSQGGASITLRAVATDAGASPIVAAEWFRGADPGRGHGVAMTPDDGGFDAPVEPVGAVVTTTGTFGERVVFVRALDSAGNWGDARALSYVITPSDGIFADGFENGSLSRWTSATGSSRLRVNATFASGGRLGLSVRLSGSLPGFVTDASPVAATAYRARFTIDAHRTSTGGRAIRLFAGRDRHGTTIVTLEYKRGSSGVAWVRAGARRAGGMSHTSWTRLRNGVHAVELSWAAARSSRLRLWIDGVGGPSRSGLDTHAYRLESVRLGPSAGLVRGMRGSFSFDRFVSTRGSRIGR